jgi:6-phosphogluconolactonase (cycloisomerase 2 family)
MHRRTRLASLAASLAFLVALLGTATVSAAQPKVVGHVYVNDNTAGQNTIAGFDRHADGSLSPIAGSPFAAGGVGTGMPFGSAGGLQRTADGRYLLATDPASNQISVLRIKSNGKLRLVDVVSSNGSTPVSITIHGNLVYVANGGAGGSNYTGFRLSHGGHLRPIAHSTYALPDDALPGHVLFSPDGRRLIGTRVGPSAGPSFIDAFGVRESGRLTPAAGSPFAAQRIGPFGSTFSPTHRNQLFVSNAHDGPGAASVSVYKVSRHADIKPIAGSPFADGQTAACWVAISPNGRALFVVNTAVPSISRFSVASDGSLTLRGSTPFASPTGLRPFDASVSPDGRSLYVVDAGAAKVSAFAVDGTGLTELSGSPFSIPGGGAPFGMVVD